VNENIFSFCSIDISDDDNNEDENEYDEIENINENEIENNENKDDKIENINNKNEIENKHYNLKYGFKPYKHIEFDLHNPKLLKIMDILEILMVDYEFNFNDSSNSIYDIIRSMLSSTFTVGFSGNNYTDFITDINYISNDELIIMLAALLNIH
jgi:hypothetical protein